MKTVSCCLLLLLFCKFYAEAQNTIPIFPPPQRIEYVKKIPLAISDLTLVNHRADSIAVKIVSDLLKDNISPKGKYRVIMGESTDPEIRKLGIQTPQCSGGYIISITDQHLLLVGFDKTGTFYAAQTLKQIIKTDPSQKIILPLLKITDFPSIPYRGVVEGFFGKTWSNAERARQFDFYGRNKMNIYIYAPKEDRFHGYAETGEVPYSRKDVREIKTLLEKAKENKINFVWAIHAGKYMKFSEAQTNIITDNLEIMYKWGVRSFGIFFDEINNVDADKQIDLINKAADFMNQKGDCGQLFFCPSVYNKSYSKLYPDYLATLNERLHPSVCILWTGDKVLGDITQASLLWAKEKLGRNPFIWWNYPVNDFIPDRLLLGRVYGLDPEMQVSSAGLVSNPMNQPESSKIALSSIADFAWNVKDFDSQVSWKHAISSLTSDHAEDFYVFARHNSDLGIHHFDYRREESVDIAPKLNDFFRAYKDHKIVNDELFKIIIEEFDSIRIATQNLLENSTNRFLLDEINPWVHSLNLVGQLGSIAMKQCRSIDKKEWQTSWDLLTQAQDLMIELQKVNRTFDNTTTQQKVSTGEKVLMPFIKSLLTLNTKRFHDFVLGNAPIITRVTTSKKDIVPCYELINNNLNTYISLDNITSEGDYFEFDLSQVYPVYSIHIIQGRCENDTQIIPYGQLEYSSNREEWHKLGVETTGENILYYGSTVMARYIRYRCTRSSRSTDVYPKVALRFADINVPLYAPRIITNTAIDTTNLITTSPLSLKLSIPSGNLSLKNGEYIGIEGLEHFLIDTCVFSNTDKNLTAEYSTNGFEWTALKGQNKNNYTLPLDRLSCRFWRLINKTPKSISIGKLNMAFYYEDTNLNNSAIIDKNLLTYTIVDLSEKHTIGLKVPGSTVVILLKEPILRGKISVSAVSNNDIVHLGYITRASVFYEFSTPFERIDSLILESDTSDKTLSISEITVK